MKARVLVAAAVLTGMTAPALAFHCPADIASIDAALANAALDPNIRNTAKTLRDTGSRLHKAGRHADAVRTLDGAKQILRQFGIRVK